MVRINSRGDVIVVWEDSRNGRNDLYAQVYDKDFNAVGDNIQINETNADYWSLNDKAIKYFSDGAFVIVFSGSDEYSEGTDVYIQLIGTRGEKVGNNKLVKAKNYNDKFNVDLNINSADEILIVWYNQYGAALKKFSKDLSLLTNEKNFLKYSDSSYLAPLVISIDTAFNVFAVWREYNFISYTSAVNIKGQFFNENGTNQTDVFLIGHASSSAYTVKCKNFSKSFAVLYNDGNVLNLIRKYDLDNEYLFKNSFSNTSYTNPIQINIVEFNNQKTFITYNSQSQAIGFYANDNSAQSTNVQPS